VIGCALAVLPTLIERLRSTADALNVQDSSPMYGVATLVLVAGVLIWSGRNGALSP
jgi:hypothetical protein